MEFALIGSLVFAMMFGIYDLGRYTVTLNSLTMLADAAARQQIICYSPNLAIQQVVSCPSDPLGDTKASIAPFIAGMEVQVVTTGSGPHVVKASVTGFNMLMPFWPDGMNDPSVSVTLPF